MRPRDAKADFEVAAKQNSADNGKQRSQAQTEQQRKPCQKTPHRVDTTQSGIDVQRLEASGGVTLRTPSETARGNFAIYDVNRRIVTLTGGVHLTQGQNRVQGGRLVLDLNSHRAVMDGGGSTGRVSGRFTVPQRQGESAN